MRKTGTLLLGTKGLVKLLLLLLVGLASSLRGGEDERPASKPVGSTEEVTSAAVAGASKMSPAKG